MHGVNVVYFNKKHRRNTFGVSTQKSQQVTVPFKTVLEILPSIGHCTCSQLAVVQQPKELIIVEEYHVVNLHVCILLLEKCNNKAS